MYTRNTTFRQQAKGYIKKKSKNKQNLIFSVKLSRFRHKDFSKGPQKNYPVNAGMKEAVGRRQERMAVGDSVKLKWV